MLQITHDEKETDRKQASLNYGARSLLGASMCQYCGGDFGMVKIWNNPDDITDDGHTWENCPECNPKGCVVIKNNVQIRKGELKWLKQNWLKI